MTAEIATEPLDIEAAKLLDVLQPQGDAAPLFLVHAMGGVTGCYQPLADRLAPHVPVYGLRAPRPGEALFPLSTVEAMAEAYLRTLATVRGLQTINLAGWSMGGLIVFEMARRLQARGVPIGSVVLIDTWMRREQFQPVQPPAHRSLLDRRRWRVFMKLASGSIGMLEDEQHQFWQLSEALKRAFILDVARVANPARYGGPDAQRRLDDDHRAYMVLRGASDAYRPGRFSGRIVWISADGEHDIDSPKVWAELASGGCEVVSCSGDHLAIVHEPFVSELADAIAAAMSRG